TVRSRIALACLALGVSCSTPGEQAANEASRPHTSTATSTPRTASDVEKRLTDVQRAALVAASRALTNWQRPSDTVSPEYVIALRQIDDMLKACTDDEEAS